MFIRLTLTAYANSYIIRILFFNLPTTFKVLFKKFSVKILAMSCLRRTIVYESRCSYLFRAAFMTSSRFSSVEKSLTKSSDTNSDVAIPTKKITNVPFVKNLFLGKFDTVIINQNIID